MVTWKRIALTEYLATEAPFDGVRVPEVTPAFEGLSDYLPVQGGGAPPVPREMLTDG